LITAPEGVAKVGLGNALVGGADVERPFGPVVVIGLTIKEIVGSSFGILVPELGGVDGIGTDGAAVGEYVGISVGLPGLSVTELVGCPPVDPWPPRKGALPGTGDAEFTSAGATIVEAVGSSVVVGA
jgi:hypothetical protein